MSVDRWCRVTALVGAVTLLGGAAGCGDDDDGDVASVVTGPPGTSVADAACANAFEAVLVDEASIEVTLEACETRQEWLDAAGDFPAVLGDDDPAVVLDSACADTGGASDVCERPS